MDTLTHRQRARGTGRKRDRKPDEQIDTDRELVGQTDRESY